MRNPKLPLDFGPCILAGHTTFDISWLEHLMQKAHVAFIVESAYGHLVPTIGIASELVQRGYRVSYAVKEQFQSRIRDCGAQPVVYQPLENKLRFFKDTLFDPALDAKAKDARWKQLYLEEMEDTHAQLEKHYRNDVPELIVYDIMNPAGRTLASVLNTATAEHSPLVIEKDNTYWRYDDTLVLVALPRFFQKDAESLGGRFQFIGFVQNGRKSFFKPWVSKNPEKRTVLVYATSGLLSQVDFFKTAIAAFRDSRWQIVLSIGDQATPDSLAPLPSNCEINRSSANFEILETADLVIGQAGTGSTLEALYHGVPQVLIPPALSVFEDCASRVAELGLGLNISPAEITAERLRNAGESLLQDQAVRSRLDEISRSMHESKGAARAADLIGERISEFGARALIGASRK